MSQINAELHTFLLWARPPATPLMSLGVQRTAYAVPIRSIAAEQTRWRVMLINECNAADQNSGLRKIILVLLALGVVSMVSLIVAGATSLISLAERIHPVAGTIVFWGHLSGSGIFCARIA